MQGILFDSRNHFRSQLGPAQPGLSLGQMGTDAQNTNVVTYTLLQSLLHVEERVGNAADFSQDLGVHLLMVLEHSVHIKLQEALGHAAYI